MTNHAGLSLKSPIKADRKAMDISANDTLRNINGDESAIENVSHGTYDGVMVKIQHSGSKNETIVTGDTRVLVTKPRDDDGDVEWIEARLLSPFHKIAEPKGDDVNSRLDVIEHDLIDVRDIDDCNDIMLFTVDGSNRILVNSMVIMLG